MKDERFLHPMLRYSTGHGVTFALFRVRGGMKPCTTRARKTFEKHLARAWTCRSGMRYCHDCGAKPSDLHTGGCDVERCPKCGGQIISCGCFTDETWPADKDRLRWTGEWPGVAECNEFGWYAKLIPGRGWVQCDKDDPLARHDLNRLYVEAHWDATLKRFVKQ